MDFLKQQENESNEDYTKRVADEGAARKAAIHKKYAKAKATSNTKDPELIKNKMPDRFADWFAEHDPTRPGDLTVDDLYSLTPEQYNDHLRKQMLQTRLTPTDRIAEVERKIAKWTKDLAEGAEMLPNQFRVMQSVLRVMKEAKEKQRLAMFNLAIPIMEHKEGANLDYNLFAEDVLKYGKIGDPERNYDPYPSDYPRNLSTGRENQGFFVGSHWRDKQRLEMNREMMIKAKMIAQKQINRNTKPNPSAWDKVEPSEPPSKRQKKK